MAEIPLTKGRKLAPEELPKFREDANVVAGEKKDGFREVLVLGEKSTHLFQASNADHTGYVPHITDVIIPEFAGTVLDCEGLGPNGKISTAKSVFSGGFARSVAWQKEHGKGQLLIFDILKYKGREVTALPFRERRQLLYEIFVTLHNDTKMQEIYLEELRKDKEAFFEEVVANGGEGVMLKHLSKGYYDPHAWYKVKRYETWDVVVTGFTPGRGSRPLQGSTMTFDEVIGAIEYGWYKGGKLVPVGRSSGMSDSERIMFTLHKENFIGTVIELKGQEIGTGGAIRFPKFVRLRPDKKPEECVWEG